MEYENNSFSNDDIITVREPVVVAYSVGSGAAVGTWESRSYNNNGTGNVLKSKPDSGVVIPKELQNLPETDCSEELLEDLDEIYRATMSQYVSGEIVPQTIDDLAAELGIYGDWRSEVIED